MIDYSIHMLGELQKLEEMSLEYKGELKYLSKRIRHDIWDVNNAENTEKLAKLLHTINSTYEITFRYIDFFDLSCIIEYVRLLAKYCIFICPNLDADYYNNKDNEGHIMIAFYNHNDEVVHIDKGERIAQGVFYQYLTVDDDISNGVIRKGGMGSTGER